MNERAFLDLITGPYKLMRNPIEFGAILYYFGLGTITCSYSIGIVCFLLGLACGSSYHKFIEEKELKHRFGEDYIKYRQNVPFLIPRIKTNKLS
jgi:protein-S-isoprenylcysteine O-methyltransferase Ste14